MSMNNGFNGTDAGIYSIFWETKDGARGTQSPDTNKATPDDIKLMIAENLLQELGIPIRLDRHLLREAKRKK